MLRSPLKFVKDSRGIAAVEFAFIAPVLATLLMGTVELCNALEANERVSGMAATIADLITQESNITTSGLSNVYAAGNAVMFPFTSTTTKIVITSIVNKNSQNTVCWSQAQNGSGYTKGTVMTIPGGLVTSNGSIILVETTFNYSSPFGKFIIGSVPMKDTFYAHPRLSTQVAYNSATC